MYINDMHTFLSNLSNLGMVSGAPGLHTPLVAQLVHRQGLKQLVLLGVNVMDETGIQLFNNNGTNPKEGVADITLVWRVVSILWY